MRTSDGSGALRRAGLRPAAALAVLLALAACSPAPTPALPAAAQGEWHEFQGTWTAAGNRHVIRLGDDRQASVADLSGSTRFSSSPLHFRNPPPMPRSQAA